MVELAWLLRCILRIVAAALMGGAIGLEREHRGRSAGFRTQMLVGVGASLAAIVGLQLVRNYAGNTFVEGVRIDPTRVAHGVMTGIGFLGAGAIISHGLGVRGMTTAASLWCTAAVGLAAGLGLYTLAAATTVIVILILYALAKIDQRIPSAWHKTVALTVPVGSAVDPARVRNMLTANSIRVVDWDMVRDVDAGRETITLQVSSAKVQPDDMMRVLADLEDVQRMSIE